MELISTPLFSTNLPFLVSGSFFCSPLHHSLENPLLLFSSPEFDNQKFDTGGDRLGTSTTETNPISSFSNAFVPFVGGGKGVSIEPTNIIWMRKGGQRRAFNERESWLGKRNGEFIGEQTRTIERVTFQEMP